MRSGTCRSMSIARAFCRSINHRFDTDRFRRAVRHSRSGNLARFSSSRVSSNLRSSARFFSVKPCFTLPSLLRSFLSAAI